MALTQTEIFERLSRAIQKLTTSASAHFGADCMLHAQLAQFILQEEGVDVRVVVGEAAWRVGPGDGDVITHSPRTGGYAPQGQAAVAYHAWLECGSSVVDFSTHALRIKAAQLDAHDGGQTTVRWCPPYLVLPHADILSLQEVAQAPDEGVAFYGEIPGLGEHLISRGRVKSADVHAQRLIRVLFDNPEIIVVGPNDTPGAAARGLAGASLSTC